MTDIVRNYASLEAAFRLHVLWFSIGPLTKETLPQKGQEMGEFEKGFFSFEAVIKQLKGFGAKPESEAFQIVSV